MDFFLGVQLHFTIDPIYIISIQFHFLILNYMEIQICFNKSRTNDGFFVTKAEFSMAARRKKSPQD